MASLNDTTIKGVLTVPTAITYKDLDGNTIYSFITTDNAYITQSGSNITNYFNRGTADDISIKYRNIYYDLYNSYNYVKKTNGFKTLLIQGGNNPIGGSKISLSLSGINMLSEKLTSLKDSYNLYNPYSDSALEDKNRILVSGYETGDKKFIITDSGRYLDINPIDGVDYGSINCDEKIIDGVPENFINYYVLFNTYNENNYSSTNVEMPLGAGKNVTFIVKIRIVQGIYPSDNITVNDRINLRNYLINNNLIYTTPREMLNARYGESNAEELFPGVYATNSIISKIGLPYHVTHPEQPDDDTYVTTQFRRAEDKRNPPFKTTDINIGYSHIAQVPLFTLENGSTKDSIWIDATYSIPKYLEVERADYSISPLGNDLIMITGSFVTKGDQYLRKDIEFKLKLKKAVEIFSVTASNVINSSKNLEYIGGDNTYQTFSNIPQWSCQIGNSSINSNYFNDIIYLKPIIDRDARDTNPANSREWLCSNGFSFSMICRYPTTDTSDFHDLLNELSL